MTSAILQAINGVFLLAALLFLLASGFTLSFGLMRVVSMAHGAYYLLGGYIGLSVARATGSFALALVAGGLAVVVLGYLVDRFLLRRTGENHLAQVLLTVGVAFVIGDVALRSGAATSSRCRYRSPCAARRSCPADSCTRPTGCC